MLLIQLTKDDPVRQYQKSNLKPYYVQGAVRDRILKRMPEDLQKTIKSTWKSACFYLTIGFA